MTSANKKIGYYDFKHSYQYPMNGGTPMEITSSSETKGEKVGEKKGSVQTTRVQDNHPWRQPRLPRKTYVPMEEEIPKRAKVLFPQAGEKSYGDANSSQRHGL